MRPFFRFLSYLSAVLAFVLLVIDGTSMIASRQFGLTATGDIVARIIEPAGLARWKSAVSRIHPFLWQAFDTIVLATPAVVVMVIASLAFWRIGRRPEPDFDSLRRSD